MTKSKKEASVSESKNSMFGRHNRHANEAHCVQNVNVEVNIDQKDDCMTSCFKALGDIFKKK